nr:MAG TPA: hypothetical protein [Caudoviricetes sp.]
MYTLIYCLVRNRRNFDAFMLDIVSTIFPKIVKLYNRLSAMCRKGNGCVG